MGTKGGRTKTAGIEAAAEMESTLEPLGIASRAYTPGPYAELESMIAAWDREYLRALDE